MYWHEIQQRKIFHCATFNAIDTSLSQHDFEHGHFAFAARFAFSPQSPGWWQVSKLCSVMYPTEQMAAVKAEIISFRMVRSVVDISAKIITNLENAHEIDG